MVDEIFAVRENRDKRARELKQQGCVVKKSSIRNQLLHPMYVEDLKHNIRKEDRGFGNTIYKTHFAVLYQIRAEETT